MNSLASSLTSRRATHLRAPRQRLCTADRITQIDTNTAAGSHRLQYSYDSLDRVTSRTLSDQAIPTPEFTTYAWDNAVRLLGHTTTVGSLSSANAATVQATRYEHDDAGRLIERSKAPGAVDDGCTCKNGK